VSIERRVNLLAFSCLLLGLGLLLNFCGDIKRMNKADAIEKGEHIP
jgi:hypothetical protein